MASESREIRPEIGDRHGSVAEAIVRRLEFHGVKHLFGIPGTHNLPFYDALTHSKIQHVAPRHEQGGGYAADGYARASGQPGVCLVTSGPGLTNIVSAVATAFADSVPLLVLAPGMSDDVLGRDTGFLHELRDQKRVMEGVLDTTYRVRTPQQGVAAVDTAFATFAHGRPRPIYVEVPLDLLDVAGPFADWTAPADSSLPNNAAVEHAAQVLASAPSVAIVLGGGAKDAGEPAMELARMLGAPIVTTVNAKGSVPESDPLSLGASIRLSSAKRFLGSREVVLVVGSELAESDLWSLPPLELEGQLIRVDIDPAQIHKNSSADIGIVADASAALKALLRRLGASHPETKPRTVDLGRLRADLVEESMQDGSQFVDLMTALHGVLDQDAIVASDSTMACYYGAVHFLTQEKPRQLLYPTGYATLGYGLPAAIGAKLALPQRQVLALMGDGGVMFTLPEIATAVEQQLSLPIVVVKNGGYGEIRHGMLNRGMRPLAVEFEPPDFAAIAEGFGGIGVRADGYGEAAKYALRALDAGRPTVIEVDESEPK